MLVALPTPPLREISMPGRRASTSARPVAPLPSMVSRSTIDTSATRSARGCSVRVAVTTVSCSEGMRAFCASSTGAASGCACAAWADTKDRTANTQGRRHSGATRRARGVRIFIGIIVNKLPEPASPPACGRQGLARLQRHAKPPCWPVSGLAERPPMPSQVLVQGAQWLVNGEGIK